jgi:hypothetical protein
MSYIFALINYIFFMHYYYYFIIALIFASSIYPQQNINLFPSGLTFMPLKANNQEARTGVLYYFENANLKVDIGNSIDLIKFSNGTQKSIFTAGIEFMAYAKSTSYSGYRLQIDAVDGFFGGNVSHMYKLDKDRILSRFRFIHNSAHLVDGSYDLQLDKWIQKEPIPFTKDFGELTVAFENNSIDFSVKYYGGFSYAVLVRPDNLKRWNYNAGIEAAALNFVGSLFDSPGNLFAAHYFSLGGADKYSGNHQTMLGVKFGDWYNKGVLFYLSYYNGSDIFSSYFDRRTSNFGAGFSVDF